MTTRRVLLVAVLLLIALAAWFLRPGTESFEGAGPDEWIARLDHADRNAAFRVQKALVQAGPRAVPMLRAILARGEDVPLRVRNEVLLAVGDIGDAAADAIPDLLRILEGEHELLRRNAAYGLRLMKSQASRLAYPLLVALEDPSPSVRAAAIDALAYLVPPDESVVPSLVAAMRDPVASVRGRACYAFYWMKKDCPEAVPALIECMADPDAMVRKLAAQGLSVAGRGSEEVMPVLVGALSDPDGRVGSQASAALIELEFTGREIEDALLRVMDHPEPSVRTITGEVLTRKLRKERWGEFERIAAWPDPELRRGGAALIGSWKERKIAPLLIPLTGDPDPWVRQAAVRAIGEIGSPRFAFALALEKTIEDPVAVVRVESALAIAAYHGASADLLGVLAGAATSGEPHTRVRAIQALLRLPVTAEELRPILVKAGEDDFEWVRIEAAVGLVLMSADDVSAVKSLGALLLAEDDGVRRRAAQVLTGLGPDAAPALHCLVESLERRRGDFSAPEISAIGAIGPAARSAVPQLVAAFRTVLNHGRVTQAADALESVEAAPETIDELLLHAVLESSFPSARKAAALRLLSRNPAGARLKFTAELTSENPVTRQRATEGLAIVGADDEDCARRILSLLSDGDAEVRTDAVKALSRLAPDLVDRVSALLPVLDDHSEDVRLHAALALGMTALSDPRHATKRLSALLVKLRDSSPSVRAAAAGSLAWLGSDAGWPVLKETLSRPGVADDRARLLAAGALAGLATRRKEAMAILVEALADPEPETRISAARTLLRLGPAARPARSALEALREDEGIATYSSGSKGRVRDMVRKALQALGE